MTNNTGIIGAHTMLPNKVVFVIGTKTYTVTSSDPRWDEVCALAVKRDYVAVREMLSESRHSYILKSVNAILKEDSVDNFKFEELKSEEEGSVDWDGRFVRVYYKGTLLPKVLQRRMFQCLEREGKDAVKAWPKFIENILANPDDHCREAVYEFLENRELPIALEDGTFIAYKGVQNDFWSAHGNKNTRVISGKVDDEGRILNSVGAVIEVVREDVDHDHGHHCSCGLHVGARSYATSFAPKTLLVKVNPRDVVTVPTDTAEKCRVSRYEVIGEWGGDNIPGTVVSVTGTQVKECQSARTMGCQFGEFITAHIDELKCIVNEYIDNTDWAVQLAPIPDDSKLNALLPDGWSPEDLDRASEDVVVDDDEYTMPCKVFAGTVYEHPDKNDWYVAAIDSYHEDCPDDIDAKDLLSNFPDCIKFDAVILEDVCAAVRNRILTRYGNPFGLDDGAMCVELVGKLLAAGYTVAEVDAGSPVGKLVISR